METKLIKVKDSATQFVCVAIKIESNTLEGKKLLGETGIDLNTNISNVYLILMETYPKFRELPNQWNDRALKNLHMSLKLNWDSYPDEFIYDVTDYFKTGGDIAIFRNLSGRGGM